MQDACLSEDEPFEAVALAASMGGLRAFSRILSGLPASFPIPILLLQHLSRSHSSCLPDLLSRITRLTVTLAREGDALSPGHVYVAPPGLHLLVRPDRILTLSDSPPVCFVRPAADRLFESLPAAFGSRAIVAVLTGRGFDGANGIRAVRKAGGLIIAQSERTCDAPDMPSAAIETGCVDMVLPLDKIAGALESLVGLSQPAHA